MEENLQSILVFFIAIIILFIFPVYFAYEKKDDIAYALVLRYTQKFTNEVKSKGYITQEEYEAYLKELEVTGNTYEVTIEHKHIKSIPNGTDEYTSEEEIFDNKHILNIISNHGVYLMNEKDKFSIKVKNTNTTIATILYNIVTINGSDVNTRIYVYCSGEIQRAKWFKNNKYMKFHIDDVSVKNLILPKEGDTFEREAIPPSNTIINGTNIFIDNRTYKNTFTMEFQTKPEKAINVDFVGKIHTDITLLDANDYNYLVYASTFDNAYSITVSVGINGMAVNGIYYSSSTAKNRMSTLVSYTGKIYKDRIYKIVVLNEKFADRQYIISIFENDKRLAAASLKAPVGYNIHQNKAYINKNYVGNITSFKIYPNQ